MQGDYILIAGIDKNETWNTFLILNVMTLGKKQNFYSICSLLAFGQQRIKQVTHELQAFWGGVDEAISLTKDAISCNIYWSVNHFFCGISTSMKCTLLK